LDESPDWRERQAGKGENVTWQEARGRSAWGQEQAEQRQENPVVLETVPERWGVFVEAHVAESKTSYCLFGEKG